MVKDCDDPWTLAVVTATGEIYPCCETRRSMGSLKEASFDEIWTSATYQRFRDAVASPSPPPECVTCRVRGWKPAESAVGAGPVRRMLRLLRG
ncbi:MAG: SPASM domain-containing protein [Acidimicrobiia bacterium]|nr:SPASM domain-containing protein [Acidimicrobiia bacterium]